MAVNSPIAEPVIDMHVHVGIRGDEWPEWGKFSNEYIGKPEFSLFLKFGRLSRDEITDPVLRERTLEIIRNTKVNKVVCLALDPIYDSAAGDRREDLSHVWVANEYISESLRPELPDKILLGASVHPYDPAFEERVRKYIKDGAVLLKWLPSAQHINLADERVLAAMKFLAGARDGKPLPLLLHIGSEYAIPPNDARTKSYDFISWTGWDRFWNTFRFKNRWFKPQTKKIRENLKAALNHGTVIIFTHLGTPYFSGGWFGGMLEHSEFKNVSNYLRETEGGQYRGRCYADISALVVHTRKPFYDDIKKLPEELILFGSDFPCPIMELSAGPQEWWKDLKNAVKKGKVDPLIVPDKNLLDVNLYELKEEFGDHPMFTNFTKLI